MFKVRRATLLVVVPRARSSPHLCGDLSPSGCPGRGAAPPGRCGLGGAVTVVLWLVLGWLLVALGVGDSFKKSVSFAHFGVLGCELLEVVAVAGVFQVR